MISNFMGDGVAPTNDGANSSVGVEDNIRGAKANDKTRRRRQLSGLAGLFGGGGSKSNGPAESGVAASRGAGASEGLPTCADDGTITMTYRQVSSIADAGRCLHVNALC